MKIPNCIICDNELRNISKQVQTDAGLSYVECDGVNQPNGGTAFMTHGHFGSTAFDPMNPSVWLEINVCDDCLTERMERVLHVTKLPKGFTTEHIHEPWNKFKHG